MSERSISSSIFRHSTISADNPQACAPHRLAVRQGEELLVAPVRGDWWPAKAKDGRVGREFRIVLAGILRFSSTDLSYQLYLGLWLRSKHDTCRFYISARL
jgi:hypothetical protein